MGNVVYFQGSLCFRKPSFLLGGCVALFVALAIGYGAIDAMLAENDWVSATVLGALSVFTAFGSAFFIWGWITDRKYPVRIDSTGVHRQSEFHAWRDIERLAVKKDRREHAIVFRIRSDTEERVIYIDNMPSADQCAQVIARIASDIGQHYPHVRFT